mmetsp:Transcript_19519/g.23437  ORF Transcript_19519/g.23437 Transcript_19519/m.23437 type:complete len:93 (-) Transcript_19519:92-370(-)
MSALMPKLVEMRLPISAMLPERRRALVVHLIAHAEVIVSVELTASAADVLDRKVVAKAASPVAVPIVLVVLVVPVEMLVLVQLAQNQAGQSI